MKLGEDTLELLRGQSGLAVDSEGRFLHRGEPILHERTILVLWQSLSRLPDGRYEVTIGREKAYVAVTETPWVVTALEPGLGDPPFVLRLAGGRREPLVAGQLSLGADGVFRYRLEGGDLARFSRAAQIALGLALDEDPPGSGRYSLGGRTVVVEPARDVNRAPGR